MIMAAKKSESLSLQRKKALIAKRNKKVLSPSKVKRLQAAKLMK